MSKTDRMHQSTAASGSQGEEPLRAGSADGIDELYAEHFDFVWRSVRHLGLSDSHVDDAVQDVFLVAHRRLADFEARSSPRTWLFAIALRVVRDYRRSQSRKARLVERVARQPHPPHENGPYDITLHIEARRLVREALGSMPEYQRIVFILAELEEMSAPEIAQATQIKLNTVYSRLRAARQRFNAEVERLERSGASDERG